MSIVIVDVSTAVPMFETLPEPGSPAEQVFWIRSDDSAF